METANTRAHTMVPPIPAVLGGIVSVQGGAAIAKGLFPALGATTTAGLRIALSALTLVIAFRPSLRRLSAAQWRVITLGIVFALVAGGCWALYIVLGGRVSRLLPGGSAVSVAMLTATLAVLPLVVMSRGLAHLTPRLAVAALVVALLSSALPCSLEMIALRALPARTFSILMSLEPAVAALCGLLFLGERLAPTQWVAIVLVIAASLGSTATTSEPTAAIEA